MGFRRESENRERVDNRGIEASTLGDSGAMWGRGVFGFEIKDETVATAESSTAASTENVPAGVKVKANDEKDDEEEDDDGAEHNLAAKGEIFDSRRRRGAGIFHGGFHCLEIENSWGNC